MGFCLDHVLVRFIAMVIDITRCGSSMCVTCFLHHSCCQRHLTQQGYNPWCHPILEEIQQIFIQKKFILCYLRVWIVSCVKLSSGKQNDHSQETGSYLIHDIRLRSISLFCCTEIRLSQSVSHARIYIMAISVVNRTVCLRQWHKRVNWILCKALSLVQVYKWK